MPDDNSIWGFLNRALPWVALNAFETVLTIAIIKTGGGGLPWCVVIPLVVYCFISYFLTYIQWNLAIRNIDKDNKINPLPPEKIYPIWIARGLLILMLSFYLLSFIFCFHC